MKIHTSAIVSTRVLNLESVPRNEVTLSTAVTGPPAVLMPDAAACTDPKMGFNSETASLACRRAAFASSESGLFVTLVVEF